ncbi:hypothetical protein [Wolbachia endosymbiont (group A) of Rhorus exstirpatorius]|uniref:hypothetical protein n=1 Tax=Wolbachia endosymbiont (group A) of Rhorus exstirpatorius TaxID=3066213 RepID=UPI00333E4766
MVRYDQKGSYLTKLWTKMQEFQNDLPGFLFSCLSNTTPFNLSIFAEQLKRVGGGCKLYCSAEWQNKVDEKRQL